MSNRWRNRLGAVLASVGIVAPFPAPAAAQATAAPAAAVPPPPPVEREFRGAWVATVDNIDWPSRKGLSTDAARQELDAIVAQAVALKLNALVFQVRPCADAMYASPLEPWSEWLTGTQGKAPDPAWDPLQHLLTNAHAHGIEVHAWFNPYRAHHPQSKSAVDPRQVQRARPELCVRYGNYVWMDPGAPGAADWSLRVIADVVQRYDVDGIHLDDYFYPYPEGKLAFPDDDSFARYRKSGGRLARGDWRRSNVDDFVARMYRDTHRQKSWVKVGISPFGIARPGQPPGIQAGIDQYEQLSADVMKWLREGWLDYLAPQLYWPIDQKAQSFAVLLPWWQQQAGVRRHLWPGLNAGRALAGKAPWRPFELQQQIELVRAQSKAPGHVHFSFKALQASGSVAAEAIRRACPEVAVPPAMAWLEGKAPPPPKLSLGGTDGALGRLSWQADAAARTMVVQVHRDGRWRSLALVGAEQGGCDVELQGVRAIAVVAASRTGQLAAPAVLPVAASGAVPQREPGPPKPGQEIRTP